MTNTYILVISHVITYIYNNEICVRSFTFAFSHITLELFSLVRLHFVSLFFPFLILYSDRFRFIYKYIYMCFFFFTTLFSILFRRTTIIHDASPYLPLPDRHGTIGNILKTYNMYHV